MSVANVSKVTRDKALLYLDQIGPIALQTFGDRAQMIKTLEELGELTRALAKRLNGSPIDDKEIVDEIADVLITGNQMRLLYGPAAVDERMIFKLDRTANFIIKMKKPQ